MTVDVFQQTAGRRILGGRLVTRFADRTSGVTWDGQATRPGVRVRNGIYVVRFRMAGSVRRVALRRAGGRFRTLASFHRPASCGLLRTFSLSRPVFGGRRPLGIAFQLGQAADVTVTVRRGGRVVRTVAAGSRPAGRTFRLRLPARRASRGNYRVQLEARTSGGERVAATLTARRP